MVGDAMAAKRTWQDVMDELLKLKKRKADGTAWRWDVAVKDKALDGLRVIPLLETRAEHFLRTMERGKVSANIYLRRIHNFAVGMNWLPSQIIPP